MDDKLVVLLEGYEVAKIKIKEWEEEIKKLQPQILELMPLDKEISATQGIFVIQQQSTWSYSPIHHKIKKELKSQEEMEKANGVAKVKTIDVLYYRQNKKEE